MRDLPGISVIVATRNRAEHLKRMLDGLLEEQYPDLEIVIVDGASTDGTVELLKSSGDKITRWVSEPDEGEYFAYNKALALASKEIIKLMTDDDQLRPGALHKAAAYLAEHPEADILFGQTAYWDTTASELRHCHDTCMLDSRQLGLKNWLRQNQGVSSISSFVRRRVFDLIGPWSTDYSCGDVEYWARAAAAGMVMRVHPDIFVDSFKHGENGIITKRRKLSTDIVRICWKYGGALSAFQMILFQHTVTPLLRLCGRHGLHPLRSIRRFRSAFL